MIPAKHALVSAETASDAPCNPDTHWQLRAAPCGAAARCIRLAGGGSSRGLACTPDSHQPGQRPLVGGFTCGNCRWPRAHLPRQPHLRCRSSRRCWFGITSSQNKPKESVRVQVRACSAWDGTSTRGDCGDSTHWRDQQPTATAAGPTTPSTACRRRSHADAQSLGEGGDSIALSEPGARTAQHASFPPPPRPR